MRALKGWFEWLVWMDKINYVAYGCEENVEDGVGGT